MLTQKTWTDGHHAAEYYLGSEMIDQVLPATWIGRLRENLAGVTEEVTAESLVQLIDFYREGQSAQRKPVTDLAFTAPKPVSIYAALVDEDKRNQVVEAHLHAVRKAMAKVESEYATAKMAFSTAQDMIRTTRGQAKIWNTPKQQQKSRFSKKPDKEEKKPKESSGKEQVYLLTHNLVAALFTHFCTRPVDGEPDPNLHTHCVIPRITDRPDGETVTLYIHLNNNALADVNMTYRRHLLDGLRRIGVKARESASVDIEIEGIGDELQEAFSRRSRRVGAMCEALSPSDFKEPTPAQRRLAAIFTREAKGNVPWQERLPGWRRRAIAVVAEQELQSLESLLQDEKAQPVWEQIWQALEKRHLAEVQRKSEVPTPSIFSGNA